MIFSLHVCFYFLFIVVFWCINSLTCTCVHDEIQANVAHTQTVNYSDTYGNRHRRSNSKVIYQPIRIKTFKLAFDQRLSSSKRRKLDIALNDAIQFAKSVLSVVAVNDTLLLSRTSCTRTWQRGPNKGKCGAVSADYRIEHCVSAVRIPNEHLDGLYIWTNTSERPSDVLFQRPEGVNNADFILYVTALSSVTCITQQSKRVVAYAGYCRLDQFDRPVAGYINLCPVSIELSNLSPGKLYMTFLHELFHALGFSSSLFDKFRDCSNTDSWPCPRITSKTVRNIKGAYRLVTPTLTKLAQKHFGCFKESKYGVPLHHANGRVSSHWHDVMMFSSIMTPKIDMYHSTVIDPMTLAFFEDTGWYKVNFTKSQDFFWGKEAGCEFGLTKFCKAISDSGKFFCSQSTLGCHYMHKSKGHCQRIGNSQCRVYQPREGDECSRSQHEKTDSKLEIFSNSSICFISNITQDENVFREPQGNCYQHRCGVNRTLEVKIKNSNWKICPYGTSLQVAGVYGEIQCPENTDLLCPELQLKTNKHSQEDQTTPYYHSIRQSTTRTTEDIGLSVATRPYSFNIFLVLIVSLQHIMNNLVQSMIDDHYGQIHLFLQNLNITEKT